MIENVLRPHLDAGLSLPEVLAATAARSGQAMSFVGRDGALRRLPYADLRQRALRLATALQRAGLEPGAPAILVLDDEERLVLSFWAVLFAGAVAVPLAAPGSFSEGDTALRKILAVHEICARAGRPPVIVTDLPVAELARLPAWRDGISGDRVLGWDLLAERAAATGDESPPAAAPGADALAVLMFSSGSTGDPKGVRLTHRQILSNLVQLCERSELTAADRSLSWLPLTHDMGLVLFHVCHTLAAIEQLKMTPLAFAQAPTRLLDLAAEHRITVLGMPNFGFDLLHRAAQDAPPGRWDLAAVRLIYDGAEPIDPQLCRAFASRFAAHGLRPHVINPGWGIAEASVAASGFPHSSLPSYGGIPSLWISTADGLSVGRAVRPVQPGTPDAFELVANGPPMTGTQLRVLDDAGRDLPAPFLGHLEIRGPNVTAGYLGGPDAEWCATGDIGFLHEGLVYLTGRAKDVLFINGRNHFSNDLEAALCSRVDWPANQLAVVGVTHPRRRVETVVVFFRPQRGGDREKTAEELRGALERILAYPVAAAIPLAALPKTTSGKIRRFELREALLRGDHDRYLEKARTAHRGLAAQEEELAAMVRELLRDPQADLDPDVPLSRHGLDSVGYVQLAFRIAAATGRQVAVPELVRAGSLAEIAQLVSRAPRAAGAAAGTRGARVPLTPRQRALWTGWLLDPNDGTYNETYWLRVEGPLDRAAWVDAARAVIACHPMLHAVVDDGSAPALVLRRAREADVASMSCPEGELEATLARLAAEPFDLRRGPLLRLRLVAAGADHVVFVSAHHLVTDGWSIHGLVSQVFAAASGAGLPAAEGELWYEPPRAHDACEPWRARVREAEPVQLPGENAAAPGRTRLVERALSDRACRAVRDWAVARGSEFTLLAGSLAALLGRLAGVGRPLLATVVSGRLAEEAQSRVGYYARTLPLVVELAPEATFAALAEALEPFRLATLGGEVPDLSELEDAAGPPLGAAVRVVYVHQNTPPIALPSGLRAAGQGQYRGLARTDLVISTRWDGRRLCTHWEYDEHRFSAEQIAGYAELYEHVLCELAAAPERPLAALDLLSPGQRRLWRPYNEAAALVGSAHDVVDRFEALAEARPELPALSDASVRLSYAALRERVDALCVLLEAHGVSPGDRVALLPDRSADNVIALLATLKSAAIAVPLDPALPRGRIAQILEDADPALLLTTPRAGLDPACAQGRATLTFSGDALTLAGRHPGRRRSPADPAYLIFTSGSTGRPKGVIGVHRSLTNLADWVPASFGYRAGETMCQFAPFSFDVSLAEILPSLCAGLHVHVLSNERRASPDLYLETMRAERVSVATVTPAYLSVLNEMPERCREALADLRLLILGGEALRTQEVRKFRAHSPHVEIVNVYGPTETTVLSTAYPLPAELRPPEWQPLGRPIARTEVWVLDELLRPCPATVTGTVFIGGDGVADGYWRDEARTSSAFRTLSPDGRPPRRLYDTGDRARLAPDGELDFAGRADNQIKLRGFRIELGEIEAALEQHSQVKQAVVTAVARVSPRAQGQADEPAPERVGGLGGRASSGPPAGSPERMLVAYVSGGDVAPAALAAHVAERLPPYMVPAAWVRVTEWPLTSNGKVDRQRLPLPADEPQAAAGEEPAGETERQLAQLFTELLGVARVRRGDRFSLLGGSSLAAAQLVNRVRTALGRELTLAQALGAPTLADLALVVEAARPATPEPTSRPRTGLPYPASEAQERMVFLERSHAGTALNHIPLTLALGGPVDAARLGEAVRALSARHPMLRARLRVEEQGVVQDEGADPAVLEVVDAAGAAGALEALGELHRRPFALDRGPLWRVALARAGGGSLAWLALTLHHAIADGVTLVRVLAELDALYRGLPLPPLEGELSYADYVAWQRELLASPYGARAGAFFADARRRLPQPPLSRAPGRGGDVAGRQFTMDLDAAETAALQAVCARLGVSPFALTVSLFGLALGQRCETHAMTLGITLAGRSRRAFEDVLGLFVNTLPLALDWAEGDRFAELAGRVQERLGELLGWQDFPLNRVLAAQGAAELPFNVLFNEEVLPPELSFGGGPAALEGVGTGIAHLPLLVSLLRSTGGWRFRIEARESSCPPEWTAGLLADVRRLVRATSGMTDARLADLRAPDEGILALLESA